MSLLPISIVTPCLNSGAHIERTIQSVLDQDYPALDYIVVDGGSTDGSLTTIRGYRDRLAHVLSEPDRGHYDALNKGFERSSGEVMGWLNSNDIYMPWTLSVVSDIFAQRSEIDWLTTTLPLLIDESDRVVYSHSFPGFCRQGFYRGENMGLPQFQASWIQQEATFWRRSLWQRSGARLEALVACDFELWARFFRYAPLYGVAVPLAGFRIHADQRSISLGIRYRDEAIAALLRHGGTIPSLRSVRLRELVRRCLPNRVQIAIGMQNARPLVIYVNGRWDVHYHYA
jgi:glycosyltransferase involved in cell wall biosynthesis